MNKDYIKIALVDDHNLFRKGLIKLINLKNLDDKYFILFEADGGEQLKAVMKPDDLPDILIMDIAMPTPEDGFLAVSWVRSTYPKVDILIISMIETEEAVVKMVKMGIKGYLSKDIEVDDMHAALQAISTKGHYYTDFVTGKLVHALNSEGTFIPEYHPAEAKDELVASLNSTEIEFLKLAATEFTYEEVANKMNKSPKTIDGYRNKLFGKLNVSSRVGLTIFAIKNGIVKV